MTDRAPSAGQILAVVVGSMLEWYDFLVFGFVSVVLARLFFPGGSEYTALLLVFATFGAGFLTRPLGGIVLGLYADRAGRKAALQLMLFLMTLAVAAIAFAPPYTRIGVAAPILMVLARLLQGFATGGVFSAASAYLVESARPARRAYAGSLVWVGIGLANMLATIVGAALTRGLTPAALEAWGWRLPFLFGLAVGPVGLYIRRYLDESREFQTLPAAGPAAVSLRTALGEHRRGVLATFLLIAFGTIPTYVVLLYMPTYAHTELGLPLADAFAAHLPALALMLPLIALCGRLADRIGYRAVIAIAVGGFLLLPYPLFAWLGAHRSPLGFMTVQMLMCAALAAVTGPMAVALVDQFPPRFRSTGVGIAYNFAVMIFGGFAPLIVTWMIRASGSPRAPAFYLIAGAVVGVVGLLSLKPASAHGVLAPVKVHG